MAQMWQSARKDLISRFGRRFRKTLKGVAGGKMKSAAPGSKIPRTGDIVAAEDGDRP